MKWISVDDELPEIGQEVIVYCPCSIRRKVTALCRLIEHEGSKHYYWDNAYPLSGNAHIQNSVTHWGYLPKEPL